MRVAVALAMVGLGMSGFAAACAQEMARADVQPIVVPTTAPVGGQMQAFKDGRFGVRFSVPPGWTVLRKDGEVSTFHNDARSAPEKAQMRAVASLGFNPYPQSVLSGATFYYSVERHAKREECAAQATSAIDPEPDSRLVGGVRFHHAHDEHGEICTEARDEVYTAYRKGACYRFDLTMNTFCSVSSGAEDLTPVQLAAMERRMTEILSTVVFSWNKGDAPETQEQAGR